MNAVYSWQTRNNLFGVTTFLYTTWVRKVDVNPFYVGTWKTKRTE